MSKTIHNFKNEQVFCPFCGGENFNQYPINGVEFAVCQACGQRHLREVLLNMKVKAKKVESETRGLFE